VRCAKCHAARHHRGFHVQTSLGPALIGRDCGRGSFGLDWDKEEQRFEFGVARQAALMRMDAAYPLLADLIAAAVGVKAGVVRLESYVAHLRGHHGKLSQAIAKALRENSGGLYFPVAVRDRGAEEANARNQAWSLVDDVENASGPEARKAARKKLDRWIDAHGVITRTEFKLAGVLRGGRCLTEIDGLGEDFSNAVLNAEALARRLREGPVEPASFIEAIRELGHAYEQVVDLNAQLDEFTGPANRQVVAAWSRGASIPGVLDAPAPWASGVVELTERLWGIVGRA
jgi:hypothetical protein